MFWTVLAERRLCKHVLANSLQSHLSKAVPRALGDGADEQEAFQ